MSQYNRKQRRDALNYAERLAIMAESAPNEFARICTFKAVNLIRKEGGLSDDEKIKDITYHLQVGCSSYTDLNRATGYQKSELARLVSIMSENGKVDIRAFEDGSRGRPMVFIELLAS